MDNSIVRLEKLVRVPRMSSACVSPDAQWVAWTWLGTGESDEAYIASTDAQAAPIRLGRTSQATRVISWSPDSQSILIECEEDGDERCWICRVDIDRPTTMTPLTPIKPNYFVRGGSVHPDGKTLVYGANVDVTTGEPIESTCVIRRDHVHGAETELARPAKCGVNVPILSPTGKHVVYFRSDRHPAGVQVWLVGIDGTDDSEIINVGDELRVQASWHPDGKRLLVLAEAGARTHRKLGFFDIERGRMEWLVDDPKLNIERAFVPVGTDRIVAWVASDARTRTVLIDAVTGQCEELESGRGELLLIAPVSEDTWVAQINASDAASDLARVMLPQSDRIPHATLSHAASRVHEAVKPLARGESISWHSVDGLKIQGWLYRPENDACGTIVCVHGGPTWHLGDEFDLEPQSFCSAGFNVLVPNYRGSTGFSLAYQESIRKTGWGGLEQEDIRTGIKALIDRGMAQPGRVGMTGLSFGGYATWHAVTHFSHELVAAAAPVCGMTDLVMDYEQTRPDLRPLTDRMMGGKPSDCPEIYRERSPIHFVDRIKARLLIVQGLQDPNVPPNHVQAIVPLLDKAGIEYEVLWLEDEGHGILKPKNNVVVLSRMIAFFTEALSESSERGEGANE